jgi:hypothetical protein
VPRRKKRPPNSEQEFENYPLRDLLKHHPISQPVQDFLCEAACVCLSRHSESPREFGVSVDRDPKTHRVHWDCPDETAKASHANTDDATRDGAYAVSLVCVERRLGLVAVMQAPRCSGADWLLMPAGQVVKARGFIDLDAPDTLVKLEVSGQDKRTLGYRMKLKRDQVGQGVAAVVGFEKALVRIERVNLDAG